MDDLIIIVACIVLIVVLAFVLIRGSMKIKKETFFIPQKVTKSQAIFALALFWSTTVYLLKFTFGISFVIAIPFVTIIVIAIYYTAVKKLFQEEGKKMQIG